MIATTPLSPCQTGPALSNDAIAALAGIVGVVLTFVIAINNMQEKRKDKK